MYTRSFSGMDTLDLDTWERRTPTKRDQDDAVKVLDALENLHTHTYGPYHHFKDVHPLMTESVSCASCIRNSTKVIFSGCVKRCEKWNIKMAKATNQQLGGFFISSPPLTYYRDSIDGAFEYAEAGFPMAIVSGVTLGGTAPATLAGSTVIANAELLAGLVLVQLINSGNGVFVIHFTNPLNMRSGIPIFGAVERGIHAAIFNQIWRHYGIPPSNTAVSDSKIMNYQSGYEKAIQLFLCALSGANSVAFSGGVYGEITYHPVMSVLDDDVAGMVKRAIGGVNVTNETLALDLIEEVGPIPGHYLSKQHTRTWWAKEQFLAKVADRTSYPEFMEKGKKDALANAKERVKEILATHRPLPLPEDQEREIDRILEEAKEWYKEQGMW